MYEAASSGLGKQNTSSQWKCVNVPGTFQVPNIMDFGSKTSQANIQLCEGRYCAPNVYLMLLEVDTFMTFEWRQLILPVTTQHTVCPPGLQRALRS